MLKNYQIEVEEVLQKVYQIRANSLSDAMDKAMEKYRKRKIVLNEECLVQTNFNEYEVIKTKKSKKKER